MNKYEKLAECFLSKKANFDSIYNLYNNDRMNKRISEIVERYMSEKREPTEQERKELDRLMIDLEKKYDYHNIKEEKDKLENEIIEKGFEIIERLPKNRKERRVLEYKRKIKLVLKFRNKFLDLQIRYFLSGLVK